MDSARYDATARALHWLVAAAVVTAVVIALAFDDVPLSPRKVRLINYHKWAGLTVLWLMFVRVAWRARHGAPALPSALQLWEQRAAQAAHAVLYVLLVATPLLGWALSSAKGFPLRYLGLVPLPDLVPKDRELAHALEPVHVAAAWSLVALAGLHVGAVVKHQVVDRIALLRRMV